MAPETVSTHFAAWISLISTGFTLAGTLAGALIAHLFQKGREKANWLHEDEIRFHKDRLAAYVEFDIAVNELLPTITDWIQGGARERLQDIPNFDLTRFLRSSHMIRMLATGSVREAADAVVGLVNALCQTSERSIEKLTEARMHLIKSSAAFIELARDEMGVEKFAAMGEQRM